MVASDGLRRSASTSTTIAGRGERHGEVDGVVEVPERTCAGEPRQRRSPATTQARAGPPVGLGAGRWRRARRTPARLTARRAARGASRGGAGRGRCRARARERSLSVPRVDRVRSAGGPAHADATTRPRAARREEDRRRGRTAVGVVGGRITSAWRSAGHRSTGRLDGADQRERVVTRRHEPGWSGERRDVEGQHHGLGDRARADRALNSSGVGCREQRGASIATAALQQLV